MKIKTLIFLFFLSVYSYSQTKTETVKYINDKLRTHSSLMSGYYEIEVSEYGNISIHRYDRTGTGKDDKDLHFIETFDFIDISIKPKIGNFNNKEYYEINFECNDSDNCISENLIHNGIKRRGNISIIGITNKKIYLALIEKFNYLKKISSKI
jgi:hypothetical protein